MKRAGKAGLGLDTSDGTMNVALLKFPGDVPGMPPGKPYYGLIHFGMWVDDLDQAAKQVEKAGGSYFMGREDHNPDTFYEVKYKDPNGVVFDITHSGWRGAIKEVEPSDEKVTAEASCKWRMTAGSSSPAAGRWGLLSASSSAGPASTSPCSTRATSSIRSRVPPPFIPRRSTSWTISACTSGSSRSGSSAHRQLLRSAGAACVIRSRHSCRRDPPSLGLAMRAGQVVARSVRHGARRPELDIRTETEVLDCSQSADAAGVEVRTADGKRERITGRYLIGADGARSTVRKRIGIAFEGFTYGERFMIIGTPYDFAQAGYAYRNYISDPVEWYNLFKIAWKGPPGVYRLVVPVSWTRRSTTSAYRKRASASFSGFTRDRNLTRSFSTIPMWCTSASPPVSLDASFSPGTPPSQQPDRRDGDEQRHPRCGQPGGQHASGSRGRRGRGRARPLCPPAPPRRSGARADRDHCQQEEHGAARSGNAAEISRGDAARAEDPVLAKKFLMRTSLIDSLRDAAKMS